MESHGLASWRGAGSGANPYVFDVLPLSWVWRSQMILFGLSCWDKDTGGISTDESRMRDIFDTVSGIKPVMEAGSSMVISLDLPDWWLTIQGANAPQLPCHVGPVEDFYVYVGEQQAILLARLQGAYPNYDWSTPITGAVDVIDRCRDGSNEAARLWEYYRDILNPNLGTPVGPKELYITGGESWLADIARCTEIVNTPDLASNRVMRCELAYRLIVFTEVLNALAVQ